MNKLIAAVMISTVLVAPAMAQMPTFTEKEVAAAAAAIAELGLDETTYQDLWCGAAFVALAEYLKSEGNAEGADVATAQSNALFARVETTLASESYTAEQLSQIGQNASIVALTQLTAGEEEFTQEVCVALAEAE